MVNESQNIQLQGKFYTIDEIEKVCKEKIQNQDVELWEKEIYLFILDWFSSPNTITVETSGSTGSAKKLQLRKRYMAASAKATLSFFNLKSGDSAWLCLPVKYIAGKMMIIRALVGHLNLNYSEPTSSPSLIINEKINFTAMVPNQVFELTSKSKGVNQLKNIETLLIGGAIITDELENNLLKLSNLNAWHSYGMTETITHIALRKISKKAKLNTYKLLPNIKIRTNHNSQLIIDAPSIGVNNLLTNDIAIVQTDGSIIIEGRSDSIIISGGVKLQPETIENKINKYFHNCFFLAGVPDAKLGNRLILFIEGSLPDDKIIELLKIKIKGSLQKFEIPKDIIYLDEFLRTETGKLKRNLMINNHIEKVK